MYPCSEIGDGPRFPRSQKCWSELSPKDTLSPWDRNFGGREYVAQADFESGRVDLRAGPGGERQEHASAFGALLDCSDILAFSRRACPGTLPAKTDRLDQGLFPSCNVVDADADVGALFLDLVFHVETNGIAVRAPDSTTNYSGAAYLLRHREQAS